MEWVARDNRLKNIVIPALAGVTMFLLLGAFSSTDVRAASLDGQNYRRAFALVDAGRVLEAEAFALHGRDPVLNKVIDGLYMAQPGNDASFETMAAFIAENPGWPGLKGIVAIAEQKIPAATPAPQVVAWFAAHPPVSLVGYYRYVDTLNAGGQTETAANLVHSRWIDGDFNSDELTVFRARFPTLIGEEEVLQRLNRRLWKEDSAGAKRLYPWVDAGRKAAAEARLALAAGSQHAPLFVERVPQPLRNEPGFLYELLRWDLRNKADDLALVLLQHQPEDNEKLDAWWEQRQIMVRRLMDRKDYEGAYRLAVAHGALEGKSLAEAEFLCGWLSLRFLDDPETAYPHFQKLYDSAVTPVSRSRGAYWLGRALEEHGDKNAARQAYETAAALNITYYGQLAAARIYDNPAIVATPEPQIPQNVRDAFYGRDMIRAVEKLHAIGERDRERAFFHAAVDVAQQRAEFALLTELAYRINRPDLAVEAGKAAHHKNMMMAAGGFPMLGHKLPPSPDPAFTLALIRQESQFNPDAHSPVGAQGLMQLMPATAKGVARKLGMTYKAKRLADPDYNIRLGAAYAANQIDAFDGSYVLALAGYNAGPGRVREWMQQIGDPRRPDVDVVDWVEQIPAHETRNYVQRIMESLQIYRARLHGGRVPLTIMEDLKR